MTAPNLPAPLGDAAGQLDLDALDKALPQVRAGLVDALQHAAKLARDARGTVVTPEDTYPLVRQLTRADEVLGQWARAFTDAAKEARALIEREAVDAMGEADGTLLGSLFVPDGAGQRIAVRADWQAGTSTWDVPSLIGWLIDDTLADIRASRRREARERYEARQAAADPNGEGIEPEPLTGAAAAAELAWYESDAREAAHEVALRLIQLGTYTPSAAKIKTLRTRLAELGRDAEAAVIAQVRSVGARVYRGTKVTREVAP